MSGEVPVLNLIDDDYRKFSAEYMTEKLCQVFNNVISSS
jgi:hypothetical protein